MKIVIFRVKRSNYTLKEAQLASKGVEHNTIFLQQYRYQVPDNDLLDANTKDVTCIVIDKPAMVQMLQPGLSATLTDYAQTVVMLRLLHAYNIRQQSIKYSRIDIVYDVYYEISIKNATREKRGRGFRCTL